MTDDLVFIEVVSRNSLVQHTNEVLEWCADNNIEADFERYWVADDIRYVSFHIKDEQHRTWFKMRW